MIEKVDNAFISAKASLKCKIVYYGSYPDLEKLDRKDEWGNFTEDWDLYVNKYISDIENNTNTPFIQLIRKGRDGTNLLQLNFDDMNIDDLSNFIKDLVEVYKTKLQA